MHWVVGMKKLKTFTYPSASQRVYGMCMARYLSYIMSIIWAPRGPYVQRQGLVEVLHIGVRLIHNELNHGQSSRLAKEKLGRRLSKKAETNHIARGTPRISGNVFLTILLCKYYIIISIGIIIFVGLN